MPFAVSMGYLTTTVLYSHFRTQDLSSSLFVMFYAMNGDALFDVIYAFNQINSFFTLVFTIVWVMIGFYMIIQLTLAIVEQGFLEAKYAQNYDFLSKNAIDPSFKDKTIEQSGLFLTPPEAMKNIQKSLRVQNVLLPYQAEKSNLIRKMYSDATSRLEESVQIQEYMEQVARIKSKKQFMLMLSLEELYASDFMSGTWGWHGKEISTMIKSLIDMKVGLMFIQAQDILENTHKIISIRRITNHVR